MSQAYAAILIDRALADTHPAILHPASRPRPPARALTSSWWSSPVSSRLPSFSMMLSLRPVDFGLAVEPSRERFLRWRRFSARWVEKSLKRARR